MKFSEKLITLRKRRGWSQHRLAHELAATGTPLSQRAVSGWEKGAAPRPEIAARLAILFHVSVDLLLDDARELPADLWDQFGAAKSTAAKNYPGDLRLQEASEHAQILEIGVRRAIKAHANQLRAIAQDMGARAKDLISQADILDSRVPDAELVSSHYPRPTADVHIAAEARVLIKKAKTRAHQNEFRNQGGVGKKDMGTAQPKAAS